MTKRLAALLFFAVSLAAPAFAEEDAAVVPVEFRCEVLTVQGNVSAYDAEGRSAPLEQGDLLKVGDSVEAGDNSYADLAYDGDWNNITRVEANSRVKIASVVPGRLDLSKGGLFAKLKKMPKDSSFEVKTPTAVATVRGTEYRTTFIDGKTDVFNASKSKIYVAPIKSDGTVDRDNTVILREDKKTHVAAAGQLPDTPAPLSPEEKEKGQALTKGIQKNVDAAVTEKRETKIQTVTQIEEYIKSEKKATHKLLHSNSEPELSRVTDDRRRPFGGDKSMAPPEPVSESETDKSIVAAEEEAPAPAAPKAPAPKPAKTQQ